MLYYCLGSAQRPSARLIPAASLARQLLPTAMLPPVEAEERHLRLEVVKLPGAKRDFVRHGSGPQLRGDYRRPRAWHALRPPYPIRHDLRSGAEHMRTIHHGRHALSALSVERGFALEDADGTLTHLGELWTGDQVRMNKEGCDPMAAFTAGQWRTTSESAPARCTGSISTAPCAWCSRTSCTECQPILFVRAYAAALPSSSPSIMHRPPALAGHPFLRFP